MLFIVKKNSPLIEYMFGLLWGFVVVVCCFIRCFWVFLFGGGICRPFFFKHNIYLAIMKSELNNFIFFFNVMTFFKTVLTTHCIR